MSATKRFIIGTSVLRVRKLIFLGPSQYDIQWSKPPKLAHLSPPPSTVAIVVDVISNQGAIRILNKDGKFVDMVGIEESGYRVIIPWDIGRLE
jgi:hypothetical protein